MRTTGIVFITVFVTGLIASCSGGAGDAYTQGYGPGPGFGKGYGKGKGYGRANHAHMLKLYQSGTATTVSGPILSVEHLPRMNHKAVELTVKTETGSTRIHVGPDYYLDEQGFAPKTGQSITISGRLVTTENYKQIIAAQIKWQGKTIQLRKDDGVPVWKPPGMLCCGPGKNQSG